MSKNEVNKPNDVMICPKCKQSRIALEYNGYSRAHKCHCCGLYHEINSSSSLESLMIQLGQIPPRIKNYMQREGIYGQS